MSLQVVLTISSNKMEMMREKRMELLQHILINTNWSTIRKIIHHQTLMEQKIELLMSK